MSDVKWIKITTDIFDDEKMYAIETMPDGQLMELIWFKLLCLAGKCNNHGFLMINNKIAYTDEMLSMVFRVEVGSVTRALTLFQQLEMIEVVDNAYMIANWDKHQNEKGLEDLRAKQRERTRRCREKQKQEKLALECKDGNVTCNVTVTSQSNVTSSYSNSLYIYNYNTHSNKENLIYILENNDKYKNINEQFKQALIDWCEYKDERKPKSKNHYSESALKKFISQAGNKASEVGIKRVVEQINIAIVNQWQGAGLERIENGK